MAQVKNLEIAIATEEITVTAERWLEACAAFGAWHENGGDAVLFLADDMDSLGSEWPEFVIHKMSATGRNLIVKP